MKLDLVLKRLVEDFCWKLPRYIFSVKVTKNDKSIVRTECIIIGRRNVHKIPLSRGTVKDQRPSINFAVVASQRRVGGFEVISAVRVTWERVFGFGFKDNALFWEDLFAFRHVLDDWIKMLVVRRLYTVIWVGRFQCKTVLRNLGKGSATGCIGPDI